MLSDMMNEFKTVYLLKDVPMTARNIANMANLINDEVDELFAETDSVVNATKEALDVIYIAAQQLNRMGVDVDAGLKELHRSNMSKALPLDGSVSLSDELEIARKRYPNAGIKEGQRVAVLVCGDTNKVIKPTTYSKAVITDEILGIK